MATARLLALLAGMQTPVKRIQPSVDIITKRVQVIAIGNTQPRVEITCTFTKQITRSHHASFQSQPRGRRHHETVNPLLILRLFQFRGGNKLKHRKLVLGKPPDKNMLVHHVLTKILPLFLEIGRNALIKTVSQKTLALILDFLLFLLHGIGNRRLTIVNLIFNHTSLACFPHNIIQTRGINLTKQPFHQIKLPLDDVTIKFCGRAVIHTFRDTSLKLFKRTLHTINRRD